MGVNSVRRWAKHFKDGNTSIEDEPRSGRPRTASTERNKERVDEIIQNDRRVTVDTFLRNVCQCRGNVVISIIVFFVRKHDLASRCLAMIYSFTVYLCLLNLTCSIHEAEIDDCLFL
jgi:hypothetical protein